MARSLLRTWWWVPLVLLLGILLKAWIVAGVVQGRAQTLAAEAADIPRERVEIVDGLDVRLTGFTDVGARDDAVAKVDALDSSWDVEGLLTEGADETEEADASADTTTAPEQTTTTVAPAGPEASSVEATVSDDSIVLTGVVGLESTRTALVAAATERFGADAVDDQLMVDANGATDDGGVLVVSGTAASEAQQAEWLSDAGDIAAPSGFEVVDQTDIADVTQELNALFELAPIEFDTARATIRANSEPTLDQAAELITANPEVESLLVIGHTDSDGDDAANLDLSQRRAEAVVAYLVNSGVDPERLEADGRGETELKVDPEVSAEDRQRNRRIEWELGS